MKIQCIELTNFRKLKSVRIEFAAKSTIFVGANNSGKTSAMLALGHFLVDHTRFTTNDITLSNWKAINVIGATFESSHGATGPDKLQASAWAPLLPSMDVWLEVAETEIHHVSHFIPKLDWTGGLIGIRLQLEPENCEALAKEYLASVKAAKDTKAEAAKKNGGSEPNVALWPTTMLEFLGRRLQSALKINAYSLDPSKLVDPVDGKARPQALPTTSVPIEGNPIRQLIRVNEIPAERGMSASSGPRERSDGENAEGADYRERRKLSSQLRSYYAKHLDPSEFPEPSDLDALEAIDKAQKIFDGKLKIGFQSALSEVEGLGYPGVTDPKLTISTSIKPIDGLHHDAAVRYQVYSNLDAAVAGYLSLPEDYNGLGYQNLIYMIFRLMSFRDGWMQVGKAGKRASADPKQLTAPRPLHLVLIEEPEAHLHAQVQQVFVQKAYDVLRNHADLGDNELLCTQLVMSTHSSHVAHACQFSWLRYFRRLPPDPKTDIPTSSVVNLSAVFNTESETDRFVTRYLRGTHCDLFFADAAILVEGPAERMLIPHFIRGHFRILDQCYITLLEIGGSHAHRLRPLIEHLGLSVLVVTDLDAVNSEGANAEVPKRNANQTSRNVTLKTWLPLKSAIDDLLDEADTGKVKTYDNLFAVRVAYQSPVSVFLGASQLSSECLANTFEDALVYANFELFRNIGGAGLLKKFREAVNAVATPAELGATLLKALNSGSKAQFALDLLFTQDPEILQPPPYIHVGLGWLQDQLKRRHEDLGLVTPSTPLAKV
jgi:predicted ATP-dependent endonuclease of OLD family